MHEQRPLSKLFLLKDEKSTSYGFPLSRETRGMFLRDIQEELKRGQALFAKHPQDFSIFEIGEYDALTGEVKLYESKNCLGLVSDFRDLSLESIPGSAN